MWLISISRNLTYINAFIIDNVRLYSISIGFIFLLIMLINCHHGNNSLFCYICLKKKKKENNRIRLCFDLCNTHTAVTSLHECTGYQDAQECRSQTFGSRHQCFLTFFFFIAQNATILYNIYHSKTQFARLNRSVTRNHWETRRRSPEFEIPQLSRLTGNGVVID